MKNLTKMARAGLLAAILLLITLATTFAADTGEIEVTEGLDGQPANRIRSTAVAMDEFGNSVVVWSHQEGVYRTVYARRYDSSGTSTALIPVETLFGSEIRGRPDVAMNDSGAFVVAWTQGFTDSDGYSVHAALYDASGTLVRAPFQVNTSEAGDQWSPSVAIDDTGNYLVAWDQKDSVNTSVEEGIYAQRYDNGGEPVGGEFLVNTDTSGFQHQVDVSMAGDGRAIVVWDSEFGDGNVISGQRFNSDGSRNAGELAIGSGPVSSGTLHPAVAMDDSGAFVVVWDDDRQDGTIRLGIHRFNADGTSAESGVLEGGGAWPDIAMDDIGNFAVAWQSGDDAVVGTYAALFDSTGTLEGDFQVNVTTDGYEEYPAVAMSDSDHYIVAWSRYLGPNDGMDGIYARFFSGPLDNTAPVANDNGYSTDEDVTLSVAAPGIVDNDNDADGDPLTVALETDVAHGSLSLNADGSFTYTPNADYHGPDSFTYTASDGELTSNVATVAINVVAINDAPVATGDSATTDEDTAVTVDVVANDSDVDGNLDPGSLSITAQPDNGTLTNLGEGTVTYTPAADYFGPDSFSYEICDSDGLCDTATVSIDVLPIGDPPAAVDDNAATDEDTALTLDLAANDSDVDGDLDPSSLGITAQPENGALTNHGDGTVTYSPAADYFGADGFSYQICDSIGLCDAATVALTVNPVNDAPVAAAGGDYSGDEGSAIALSGTASDVDGDTLSFSWSSDGPCTFSDAGALNPTITCTDDGSFTATLTVDDGAVTATSDATVMVANVAPTIDAIEAPTDPVAIDAQPVSIRVFFSDPGTSDTHHTFVYWGDYDGILAEPGPSPVTAERTYAEAGVYTLEITVEDDDGGEVVTTYEYIVIYDPAGGFVTGHGRINSEEGWCRLDEVCRGTEGIAHFGFYSRLNRGATVPTGRTDFVFRAGGLDFESTSYNWLVVNQNGSNAQFRGEGLINGNTAPGGAAYQFMIWAGEGTGSNGEDTFRIKIWYEAGGVEVPVYDNGSGQPIGRDKGKIRVQAW